MSKKIKSGLKIFISIIIIVLLIHTTKNYLIPFILKMHNVGAY